MGIEQEKNDLVPKQNMKNIDKLLIIITAVIITLLVISVIILFLMVNGLNNSVKQLQNTSGEREDIYSKFLQKINESNVQTEDYLSAIRQEMGDMKTDLFTVWLTLQDVNAQNDISRQLASFSNNITCFNMLQSNIVYDKNRVYFQWREMNNTGIDIDYANKKITCLRGQIQINCTDICSQ